MRPQIAWSPGRTILNAVEARQPDHRCDIPVQARIEWADGGEQWLDTRALGWASGEFVYVHMWGTG